MAYMSYGIMGYGAVRLWSFLERGQLERKDRKEREERKERKSDQQIEDRLLYIQAYRGSRAGARRDFTQRTVITRVIIRVINGSQ